MLRPDTFAMTATLALLTALAPLSTDLYLPSLPAIARDLGSTSAGAQLTLSAFLLGFATGQLVYGPVSDKLGRRPVLLFGFALFIAASALCTVAPGIGTLVAGRFVQALGASGPIVLARAMVRDLYEGSRAGRELSRMGTIMGVVPALAPLAGGVLHDLAGWRANFAATLVLGVAILAHVAVALPETLRAPTPGPLSLAAVLADFRGLLRHPTYRVYVGLASLSYSGLFAFISGSSFVLQTVYGLSEMGFAVSFVGMVAGYVAGTFAAQHLVGRRGLDGTMALGTALLAVGGAAMLALVAGGLGSPAALITTMAVYAAGVGLTLPLAIAAAMLPFPRHAGAASSLLGIGQMVLAALVGIGIGQALGAAGASALPLAAPVGGIGLVAFALFQASRTLRATSHAARPSLDPDETRG